MKTLKTLARVRLKKEDSTKLEMTKGTLHLISQRYKGPLETIMATLRQPIRSAAGDRELSGHVHLSGLRHQQRENLHRSIMSPETESVIIILPSGEAEDHMASLLNSS
jgi:hypothetical protein